MLLGTSGRSHWQVGCAGLGFPNSRDMRSACGRLGSVLELEMFLYLDLDLDLDVGLFDFDFVFHLYLDLCYLDLDHLNLVGVGGVLLLKTTKII